MTASATIRAEHSAAVETTAWIFYVIAAGGSTIGQIWVGIDTPPWPDHTPWWLRAIVVLPFAVVIDLGGVVAAAFADARRRLGEAATLWRVLSACSVTVGVAINIVGHHQVPYLAVVFGGLGVFAYCVWLGHSASRRRDALRATGKLADTAPAYGFAQRRREPAVTRRAEALAVEHGYGLHQSLAVARQQLRDEQRNAALTTHIEMLLRARHDDPVLASIAVTTIDIEAVAAHLRTLTDVQGWAVAIGARLVPPAPADEIATPLPALDERPETAVPLPPADVLRRVPTRQVEYDRWRQLWAELIADPDIDTKAFSHRHGISVRQVQWIRAVGAIRLLDSPIPPATRLVQLAQLTRSHHGEAPTTAPDGPRQNDSTSP